MGRFEDMIEGLREDIEVPETVWEKYTDTLSHLPDQKGQTSRRFVKRIKWPVAAAAALFVGVAGVSAAAYMQWSKALEERLRITEEQHQGQTFVITVDLLALFLYHTYIIAHQNRFVNSFSDLT